MKKIKLLTPILAIAPFATMFAISSCANNAIEAKINGSDYVITEQSIDLTFKLTSPQNIDKVKWSVSDGTKAKITSTGKLTGIREGVVKVSVEITFNGQVKTATKDIAVIDKDNIKFIEFLGVYSYFLNNYLQSSKSYSIEPVGKYEDMEYRDQIIDNIILTKFSEYPNQHYLKINTMSQRRFIFCAAGRSIADLYQLMTNMYTDAKNELKNTGQYSSDYKLYETYKIDESSIYYQVVAKTDVEGQQEYNFIELRINSNGYIDKLTNTTAPEAGHAGEEYGCFELKYTEK